MKVELENEKEKVVDNKLKIFYIVIISICIIAIATAIFLQIKGNKEQIKQPALPSNPEQQVGDSKEQFNSIFKNQVNYMENNSYKITKIEQDKEIIYTGYKDDNKKVNDYELNVNIPYINIKNDKTIEKFNQEIRDTFEKKAKSVLNTQNNNVIYTVNYSAYVTNNILSLVVRSTLKEGNNPQRDIVQTYNYDLTNQREITVQDILELKGITKQEANKKIKDEIKKVQETVEELANLGYSVYSRDYESDIYSINNVSEYFIGENNALYIIYAYGNENHTSEMDIVVM